jgi:Spy/CpxP family protein refolding chaperone
MGDIATTFFKRRIIMKNHLRIFCIVLAASLFGVIANLSAAEPPPDSPSGMGPGMMGVYGPYGMGPGVMGGYGMGPGMMGGYGPGYGMGPGMMGWGNYKELNLSAEQKSRITQVQKEMRTKQWALMAQMMDAQDNLQDLYDVDKQDAAEINKQYKEIEDLRRQMVDNSVEAHNRINAILTKEQRQKSREFGHGYGHMMWGY